MQTESEQRFATESIPKLMVTMAIPSVIAQFINILYNIVDRIYIGHIEGVGAAALTGVGVTFPVITLISAFSAFVGRGGAPLAAIWMGKGDQKHAEKILGNGALLLTIFSVLLTAVFLIWQRPLLYMFGASDATIGYACDYLTIYLLGTWFVQLALGLNPFIISQGKPRTAMLAPTFYASLFSNDLELIALVGRVMPVFLFGMLFFGLQNGIQPSFLSLGQAGISLFIAMFRKVILLVPLALILPRFFGVMGIYYAEPVSDIISAATATVLFALNINRILSKEYLERIR